MRKLMICIALLLNATVLVAVPVAVPAAAQDSDTATMIYGGVERGYYLHVPAAYDGSSPVPLVVALHTTSSSGRAMAALTGLDDAADDQGFIVVYPNSLGSAWGEDPTNLDAPDDLGFIPALIDQLAETYTIDTDRVYLTGWGGGGLMAYRLACELPGRFASVAVLGPLMWDRNRAACPGVTSAPVDILMIYGTDDPFYFPDTHLYQSLWDPQQYTILGVDDTISFWALRNGCDLASAQVEEQTRLFPTCRGGVRVAFYDVAGSRGSWPRIGDYQLNPFGIDATAMITSFFAGGDEWNVPQPPFEGQARSYILYVPSSYDPARPMPVVMTLHGRFSTGAGTAGYTGMNEIAEREGFIALYPDGLLNRDATYPYDFGWNYVHGVSYARDDGPNDGAFLDTLLDDLALDLNIDTRRIYVDGMSNGGFMVHALACTNPERYAAFGTVAGSAFGGFEELCQHDLPVSMVIIHGTYDDNVIWEGRTEMINGQEYVVSYPVLDMLSFWAVHDQCDVEQVEVADLPQGGESPYTAVRILTLSECAVDSEVKLYAVIGGGHNWPGIPSEDEADNAQINMDINAGEVLWAFFAQHELAIGPSRGSG